MVAYFPFHEDDAADSYFESGEAGNWRRASLPLPCETSRELSLRYFVDEAASAPSLACSHGYASMLSLQSTETSVESWWTKCDLPIYLSIYLSIHICSSEDPSTLQ
jgi:hypothetical protein